jgi:phosphopantothenoylcysteine decarboxylase/phosphopantothenate--cysteine ligase
MIGFAAETEKLVDHAKKKLTNKNCDWIVANDVSKEKGVMGGNENEVLLVTDEGVENWPQLRKEQVAGRLMERAAAWLQAYRPRQTVAE